MKTFITRAFVLFLEQNLWDSQNPSCPSETFELSKKLRKSEFCTKSTMVDEYTSHYGDGILALPLTKVHIEAIHHLDTIIQRFFAHTGRSSQKHS